MLQSTRRSETIKLQMFNSAAVATATAAAGGNNDCEVMEAPSVACDIVTVM